MFWAKCRKSKIGHEKMVMTKLRNGDGKVMEKYSVKSVGTLNVTLWMRKRDYLAVTSIGMHGIYLDTQLSNIYIDINIVEIDKGKDM